MPNRSPLRQARDLFLDIQALNAASRQDTGDIDLSGTADLIEIALEDEVTRRGIMLALAEYVASAMDGCAIDVAQWTPLVRVTPRLKKSAP